MPRLVVVDGSNIATEGRSMPSLMQLNEAVLAFRAEFPDDLITVVVDATFGHRIDPREVAEFDAAVEHNELVSPPAGAIGRGDAFVLSIANKAGATILSNDSFQEFHAQYSWLFDEGRLIGGKPVPHVGWVFVARSPVRGPVSRRAVRDAQRGGRKAHTTTVLPPPVSAAGPPPTPKSPPPGKAATTRRARKGRTETEAPASAPVAPVAPVAVPEPASGRGQMVNELLPFLSFVEAHPVGTEVEATTESYSSHGAYVTIGEVRGYVPLRLMGSPPPRSAREVLRLGEPVAAVVASFNAARRSIDLALPGVSVPEAEAEPVAAARPSRRRRGRKEAGEEPTVIAEVPAEALEVVPEPPAPARRRRRAADAPAPAAPAPADGAPEPGRPEDGEAGGAPAEPAAEAPGRKAARKATPAKAKKAPAKKATAARARKAAAEAAPDGTAEAPPAPAAKKAAARKATATKATATKAAGKTATKKAPAKAAKAAKATERATEKVAKKATKKATKKAVAPEPAGDA